MTSPFRVGSLFAGIGGFDLGLERTNGFEVVWQVEWDSYCQKVLAKHWPSVPCYGDIHDVGAHNLAPVDVLVGGFPCQPVSVAGKRKGQDDDRWLWPEFGRIIRELRPRYAIMENVPGLLVRGMGDVLGDLSEFGYDAEWGIVSAASVGAPHLRKRIFIMAHATGSRSKARRRDAMGTGDRSRRDEGLSQGTGGKAGGVADTSVIRLQKHGQLQPKESIEPSKDVAHAQSRKSREQTQRQRGEDIERGSLDSRRSSDKGGKAGDVADTHHEGLRTRKRRSISESLQEDDTRRDHKRRDGDNDSNEVGKPSILREDAEEVAHAQGEQSSSDDYGKKQGEVGESKQVQFGRGSGGQSWERNWAVEPDVGRVAHGVPNRVDRLKGLGNAIVPQVAEYIGRRVLAHAESQERMNGK